MGEQEFWVGYVLGVLSVFAFNVACGVLFFWFFPLIDDETDERRNDDG